MIIIDNKDTVFFLRQEDVVWAEEEVNAVDPSSGCIIVHLDMLGQYTELYISDMSVPRLLETFKKAGYGAITIKNPFRVE